MIDEFDQIDIASDDFTKATKNLAEFSKVLTLLPEPESEPIPVPVTRWERFQAGTAAVWDNETTRVALKAGGALAGVALVVYTSIYKDHVMERQALAQANQRNS
jgi:hypothetical protein